MTDETKELVERLRDNADSYLPNWNVTSVALQREAADLIESLASRLAAAEADAGRLQWTVGVIEKLQRALAFWHPGVGGRDDDAFLTRACDDAELLFGYEGPNEPSALELGWIAVQNAARDEAVGGR